MMDQVAAERDDLVAEVDLALAHLRRVILRAMQGAAKPAAPAMTPSAAPPASAPRCLAASGIEIAGLTISFRGRAAEVSHRQAELAAVLAKASPSFIAREDAVARAWPDLKALSRETYVGVVISALVRKLGPLGIEVEAKRGYGLRLYVEDRQ